MDNPLIKQQEYYRKLIELEDLINNQEMVNQQFNMSRIYKINIQIKKLC